MKNERWSARVLVLSVATLLSVPGYAEDEASSRNSIEFVTHARASGGVVRCGLFRKEGWLKKPVRAASARVHARKAVCVFKGMPGGTYGISAFHDENGNGKIDTNLVGMPVEDYCASRDARGVFGPPSFEDAKFKYEGGNRRLEARLK